MKKLTITGFITVAAITGATYFSTAQAGGMGMGSNRSSQNEPPGFGYGAGPRYGRSTGDRRGSGMGMGNRRGPLEGARPGSRYGYGPGDRGGSGFGMGNP